MTDKQRHISDLSGEELAEIGCRAAARIRKESFALGLPVCYMRDGVVVNEYPDGRIESAARSVSEAAG